MTPPVKPSIPSNNFLLGFRKTNTIEAPNIVSPQVNKPATSAAHTGFIDSKNVTN